MHNSVKAVVGILRSLYISASGMLAQRRVMDVLTNNLANVETVGFKRDRLMTESFSDVLLERINDPEGNNGPIGYLNWGVHPDVIATDFNEGSLEWTGRASDVALSGDGFFVVETPQGLRYTRSGNFQVDSAGFLCTNEGYYVHSAAGRIHVGAQEFSVDMQGNIDSPGGAYQLLLVRFEDNTVLRKEGVNLYAGPAEVALADCEVMQGYLESSNVDLASEMVHMITVSRNYEANQRMVSMLNETLQKTVNEVGRV